MGGVVKAATGLLSGIVGDMVGGGGQQSAPPPPPPPAPPAATPPGYQQPQSPETAGTAGISSAGNQSAGARAAGAAGFGSTVITGPEGLKAGSESTSQKKLLGS